MLAGACVMSAVTVTMTVWAMDDEDAQDIRRTVCGAMSRSGNDFRVMDPELQPPHTGGCDHAPCDHPRRPS